LRRRGIDAKGAPCSLAILSHSPGKETVQLFDRIVKEEPTNGVRWGIAAGGLARSNLVALEEILLDIFEKGALTVGLAKAMAGLQNHRVNEAIAERLPKMPLMERHTILGVANETQGISFLPVVKGLIDSGDLDDPTWEYFSHRSGAQFWEMEQPVRDALVCATREEVEKLLEKMNARQVKKCISDLSLRANKLWNWFADGSPDDWEGDFGDDEREELKSLRARHGWVKEYLTNAARGKTRSKLSLSQIEQVREKVRPRKRKL
jgi:hypothetical protein